MVPGSPGDPEPGGCCYVADGGRWTPGPPPLSRRPPSPVPRAAPTGPENGSTALSGSEVGSPDDRPPPSPAPWRGLLPPASERAGVFAAGLPAV